MNTLIIVALVVWTVIGIGTIAITALVAPIYWPIIKMSKSMFKSMADDLENIED